MFLNPYARRALKKKSMPWLTYHPRLNGFQKVFWEIKVTGLIQIVAPIECRLVNQNMGLAPKPRQASWCGMSSLLVCLLDKLGRHNADVSRLLWQSGWIPVHQYGCAFHPASFSRYQRPGLACEGSLSLHNDTSHMDHSLREKITQYDSAQCTKHRSTGQPPHISI